jgi:hypothetical protein
MPTPTVPTVPESVLAATATVIAAPSASQYRSTELLLAMRAERDAVSKLENKGREVNTLQDLGV